MFRPGFVRPRRGLKSRVRWYRVFYAVLKPFAAAMEHTMPKQVTNTQRIGRAMLYVAKTKPGVRFLTAKEINEFAAAHG